MPTDKPSAILFLVLSSDLLLACDDNPVTAMETALDELRRTWLDGDPYTHDAAMREVSALTLIRVEAVGLLAPSLRDRLGRIFNLDLSDATPAIRRAA